MQGQLQTATSMQKEKWVLLKNTETLNPGPELPHSTGPLAPALTRHTHV